MTKFKSRSVGRVVIALAGMVLAAALHGCRRDDPSLEPPRNDQPREAAQTPERADGTEPGALATGQPQVNDGPARHATRGADSRTPFPGARAGATREFERLIAIAPNSAEILCALGAGDRIVGVGKFCVYPPELKDKPKVGGLFDPDLERIVALAPDLVVLRGHNEALEKLCRDMNIRLYHDPTESFDDLKTCVMELGALLNQPDRARVLIDDFQRAVDDIVERVEPRVRESGRPGVLLTTARRLDALENVLTTGKGTFHDAMIELAGGRNVFGQVDMKYPTATPEEILARRPDIIIELMPETVITPEWRERITRQWERLGPIPAVTRGRIYVLGAEYDYSLAPSLRSVDIIEALAERIHPDLVHRPPGGAD